MASPIQRSGDTKTPTNINISNAKSSTPPPGISVEQLTFNIFNLFLSGKNKQQVVDMLMSDNWENNLARDYVNELALSFPSWKENMKKSSFKAMLSGLGFLILGLAITIGTYSMSSSGGTYVVTWGFIIYGIVGLFKGLFEWMKYNKTVKIV